MQWYSPIKIPNYPFSIHHQTKVLAVGSCFAEHMGQRLMQWKFNALLNPFGILYNPASVQRCFSRLATATPFTAEDLFEQDGLWHSFQHHGRFSANDKQAALHQMNAALDAGHKQWQTAEVVIVTLGTAWAYRHKTSCEIVANNHKLPAAAFDRELLGIDQIKGLLQSIIIPTMERSSPPKWLLTVSPVRHLKDGAIGNNRSKAHLLAAVHDMVESFDNVHYFPGYELLLDELRDYRFYTSDHAHPSVEAVDHIWSRFGEVLFHESTRQLNKELASIRQAMQHRPLHKDNPAYQQFRVQQRKKLTALSAAHPYLPLADWHSFFDN